MKIYEVFKKIRKNGNDSVANGLMKSVNHFENMVNVDGGKYWDAFIKGYSRCLLNLGYINYEDVETINEFLFEKYVSNVKGGDKPE